MTNSRQKGKRAELELASILRSAGFEAKRGVQYQGGPDSPDVVGLPGVHVEVKHVEKLNIFDAMDQSRRDTGVCELPIVAHRKNRKPWLVTMDLDDWLKLYKGWLENHEQMENGGMTGKAARLRWDGSEFHRDVVDVT